jgi:hypothetical protein
MRTTLLAALVLALPMAAAPGRTMVYHVSPDGSDQRSGESAETAFATLERARRAVRELKRSQGGTLQQPVTVAVHGGTYWLSKPLQFTAEDSGAPGVPVIWEAFGSDRPVLSGGRAIHGWNEVAVGGRKLWTMNVPAVRDGKWYFRELWINGGRRQRARSPNDGFYRIAALPDLDVSKPYQNGQRRFVYTPGEIKAWDNLADAEIVTLHFWVSTRTGIASVDESKNLVNLTESSGMRLTDGFGKQPQLARYYVENAFELLDAPGEW